LPMTNEGYEYRELPQEKDPKSFCGEETGREGFQQKEILPNRVSRIEINPGRGRASKRDVLMTNHSGEDPRGKGGPGGKTKKSYLPGS